MSRTSLPWKRTAALSCAVVAVALQAAGQGATAPHGAPGSSAAERAADARATLAAHPDDVRAQARLAAAAVQLIRETGDGGWYAVADRAGTRALRRDPRNVEALDAMATLANSRHRFADGLSYARRSLAVAPGRFGPLDTMTDSLVELGRYRQAFANAEHRLALRPDAPSYARASYAAELQGDRDRAIELMRLAAEASPPTTEGQSWSRVQLGLSLLAAGRIDDAERQMHRALAENPGFPRAIAGLGRVEASRGHLRTARRLFDRANTASPFIEFAVLRVETDRALGDQAAVAQGLAQIDELARAERRAGVRIDLDMASILADYRTPSGKDIAVARAARLTRPGIQGDQVLGWVLTRAGRCEEGLHYARRSLRLGTHDPLIVFRAGAAAACSGHRASARRWLRASLAENPRFSVRWAPEARRMLAELEASPTALPRTER